MELQLLITVLFIGAAAAYLILQGLRAWNGLNKGKCGGGCCAKSQPSNSPPAPILIAPENLKLRQKR